MRAALFDARNVPKPVNVTESPLATLLITADMNASRASAAAFFVRPVLPAIKSTNVLLFIVGTPFRDWISFHVSCFEKIREYGHSMYYRDKECQVFACYIGIPTTLPKVERNNILKTPRGSKNNNIVSQEVLYKLSFQKPNHKAKHNWTSSQRTRFHLKENCIRFFFREKLCRYRAIEPIN